MEIEIGRGKKARRAYGFDDIAIVPSRRTRDPDDVDISWKLGDYRFELPLLASAMDGVVSPTTARDHRQARRPRRPEPRGHLHPLRGRRRAARAHRRSCPRTSPRARCRRSTSEPIKPELIAAADRARSRTSGVVAAALADAAARRAALRARARRRASTSSSSRARSSRPSTSRKTTEPLNLKEFIREVAGARSSSAAAPATTRACT